MEPHKAQHPTLIPLLWQELGVFFSWHVTAALHKPQRGLWERPGQARAWGCQGREKGLGLNENKLPDCNNFIPYILLSPIQSLSCFLSCRGSQSFSPVAVRIAAASLNSLRVFSALDGAAERKPHVTDWMQQEDYYQALTRVMLWLLVLLLFPYKSCRHCLLPLILRSLHSGSI